VTQTYWCFCYVYATHVVLYKCDLVAQHMLWNWRNANLRTKRKSLFWESEMEFKSIKYVLLNIKIGNNILWIRNNMHELSGSPKRIIIIVKWLISMTFFILPLLNLVIQYIKGREKVERERERENARFLIPFTFILQLYSWHPLSASHQRLLKKKKDWNNFKRKLICCSKWQMKFTTWSSHQLALLVWHVHLNFSRSPMFL